MSKAKELTLFLFEGNSPHLAAQVTQWMDSSPRFLDFVKTYRDKIRKKIRMAQESRQLLDLSAELEIGYQLLSDRRLDVEYEPYASRGGRGADFRVTFRSNLKFNIEVASLHAVEGDAAGDRRNKERVVRIILGKLGQMQPKMPNLLVIHVNKEVGQRIDLQKLMQELKTKAETRDLDFYERTGYAGPTEFFKYFLRLSGVLFWEPEGKLWINNQANMTLDEKVLRLIRSRRLQDESSA